MKKIIILALALLSMAQVWAKEPVTRFREKLFDNKSKYVTVVAHRGDWRNSPENSMQAFRNCLEMGVDMIEIDVRKTKDNELVIIHDATVDRTVIYFILCYQRRRIECQEKKLKKSIFFLIKKV